MLIVGERINTFKKSVMRAYEQKDAEFIRSEVLRQAEAGAEVIDLNAGSSLEVEPENMRWAVKIAQEAVDLPLSIDSPNPGTIQAGFAACRRPELAWVNSVTLEKERLEELLPLAREHGCPLVALCRDSEGLAQDGGQRVEVGKRIADTVDRAGISLDKLYLDTLIEPISVHSDAAMVSLATLEGLKRALPGIKTIISLSGVSFGLPGRKLLHRVYLPLLMRGGLDAVFLDPLDRALMSAIKAAEALLGRDEFCMGYIGAHREGSIEG
jgi:5-methyltetrahydrofolate--homocysteine methyltransferase